MKRAIARLSYIGVLAMGCGPTPADSTTAPVVTTETDDAPDLDSATEGQGSAETDVPVTDETDWDLLTGAWHEDGHAAAGEPRTFVPRGTPVPPSRFVQRLTFGPGTAVTITTAAANDGHYPIAGTYSRLGDTLTLDIGSQQYTVEVLTLGPELLEIHSNIPG